MLSYSYQILGEKGYTTYQNTDFKDAENLLASILDYGVKMEIRRGMKKDYIIKRDSQCSTIKGKIIISDTSRHLFISRTATCEYDEYSLDNISNQIIKSTILFEVKSDTLDPIIKNSFRAKLIYFSSVTEVPISSIRWDNLKFDRNSTSTRMLINICYLLINGLVFNETNFGYRNKRVIDSQKLHALYENFIRAYYKKHFPILNATASHINWKTDSCIDFLPEMRSDITLTFNSKKLIIDAKYYEKSMQIGRFGNHSIHSNNLFQIFTYVHNADVLNNHSVSGMLLYAKTDEQITPDCSYVLNGYNFDIQSLDLNCEFEKIKMQLDNIVVQWVGDCHFLENKIE